MPNCPHCNANYIAGEPYCPTCGEALPSPILWPPRAQEPPAPKGQAHQHERAPAPEGTPATPARPQHLRLQLPSGILLDLNGRQSAVIGRKDGAARPDIDLAPHRGAELGVSREHAMIVLEQGRYYVKDLDSTNNTFLNAGRLFPDQLYPLKHNDHLTLGEMEMRVVLQSGT